MARTTFSICYYCRKSNRNKSGQAPLEMSININGERLFLNLPVKFRPDEFSKKRKPHYVQKILDEYRVKANCVIAELLAEHIPTHAGILNSRHSTLDKSTPSENLRASGTLMKRSAQETAAPQRQVQSQTTKQQSFANLLAELVPFWNRSNFTIFELSSQNRDFNSLSCEIFTNLIVKIQKPRIQRVLPDFVEQNSSTYHKIKKYYYICILYDMLSIHYGQKYYGNTSSEKIGRKYEDCR